MAESSDNAGKQAKGAGAPPPVPRQRPQSGGLDHEIDAVANLFRADQTLRAPSLPAIPSEAELTRRRSSLFEDSVADPLPAPPQPAGGPARASRAGAPPSGKVALDGESTRKSGVRDRARSDALELLESVFPEQKRAAPAPAAPAAPAVPAEKPEAEPARRRPMGGPRPATLAIIGVAAVITLSTVAMVLGLIPKPWANQSEEAVGAVARPVLPRPVSQPANVVKAAAVAVAEPKVAEPSPSPSANPTPSPSATASATATPSPTPTPTLTPTPTPTLTPTPSAAPTPNAAPTPSAAATPTPAQVTTLAAAAPEPTPSPPASAEPASPASEDSPASSDGAKVLASARKLLAADEPAKAEAILRQQLALDPQDHHTMELLARALMDQDRGAEAVPYARKIVQRRPKRVPYRLLLGDLLLMIGDQAGAHAEWKQALELDPGNAEIERRLK